MTAQNRVKIDTTVTTEDGMEHRVFHTLTEAQQKTWDQFRNVYGMNSQQVYAGLLKIGLEMQEGLFAPRDTEEGNPDAN